MSESEIKAWIILGFVYLVCIIGTIFIVRAENEKD
jgi:hypothetical protein